MRIQLEGHQCRQRQLRFAQFLANRDTDLAVITDWRDVYYFTGVITEMPYPRAFIMELGKNTTLVAEREFAEAAVDLQCAYPLQALATLNFQPNAALACILEDAVPKGKRIAVQHESLLGAAARAIAGRNGADLIPVDDDLLRIQAIKDGDEIRVMKRANELNDVGYSAVREAIREGASEAEVLAVGKAAVTRTAEGECFYNGDFCCAQPGGFATERRCRAGELYIVDAWVCYQGYWSDNCRTFPVTSIDDAQRKAWETTEQTVLMAEQMVKPGVSCREVFYAMKAMQDGIKPNALIHHGGHGVGLRSHGYPRINPHFDDTFEAGNTITIEPGVYGKELRGGIRLEHNYLVTQEGVDRLNKFPISVPDRDDRHLGSRISD